MELKTLWYRRYLDEETQMDSIDIFYVEPPDVYSVMDDPDGRSLFKVLYTEDGSAAIGRRFCMLDVLDPLASSIFL